MSPHAFTLRQLQYAVAVAEGLSFRKAARACHVSQPSLSMQIAQLEAMLEVKLFERDRRRVLVTSAGQQVLTRARVVLKEADDLARAARLFADPLVGSLRIGIIPTISPYLLPTITRALRETFPKLTVLWIEDKTEVLVQSLETGGLDAALLALEANVGDVEREVIAKDAFFLATAKNDPLGKKRGAAKQAELTDANVLLLDDGHCFREQALAVCSRAGAHELEFRATSLSTLAQMVAGGAGVTLLPALALNTEAQRAELEVRPLAAPAPFRTIALVWRKRSPVSGALREVSAAIRKAYPGESKKRAQSGESTG